MEVSIVIYDATIMLDRIFLYHAGLVHLHAAGGGKDSSGGVRDLLELGRQSVLFKYTFIILRYPESVGQFYQFTTSISHHNQS